MSRKVTRSDTYLQNYKQILLNNTLSYDREAYLTCRDGYMPVFIPYSNEF